MSIKFEFCEREENSPKKKKYKMSRAIVPIGMAVVAILYVVVNLYIISN